VLYYKYIYLYLIDMTNAELIKVLCLRSNISVSELARRMGQTPQNFNAKLKRGTIRNEDLILIGKLLNAKYEQSFILSNGEIIK